MSRTPSLVVGLVAGSHVVNHAYLLLFPPAFPLLAEEFGASLAALGMVYTGVTLVAVRHIPNDIARAGALAADEEESVDAPSTLGATARGSRHTARAATTV